MYLNFGIIADTIGVRLYEKRKSLILSRSFNSSVFSEIEEMRKVIIYDKKPRNDWYESIVEFFYQDDESLDFYMDYSEGRFEMPLLNKVMYQLLHGYHEAIPEDIPTKSGFKLPRPKRM